MPHLQYLARLLILTLFPALNLPAEPLNVAVASNMSHAITEIAEVFQRDTGLRPGLTMGSSGNFTRQLIQGAPYKVFLSAASSYVRILEENNIGMLDDIVFAHGRIAIFIPRNSELYDVNELPAVIKKMYHGNYSRLVMANPAHAPFGIAAQQALQSAGLWVVEKQRLLLAENAAQATQIAMSGNVDVGIVASSHLTLPAIAGKGRHYLVPASWHEPLRQHLVLLQGANNSETRFFDFLQTDEAKQILLKHGYSPVLDESIDKKHGLAGP